MRKGNTLCFISQTKLLEKMYGKGVSLETAASKGSQIIESAAMLNLQEKNKIEASLLTPSKASSSSVNTSMGGENTPFKVFWFSG